MKPYLEKLAPSEHSSLNSLNRRLEGGIPFQWHHHPEFELTLTLNSRGQRFIGDHVGTYDDLDLVLIGPNLPHSWSSVDRLDDTAPHVALVFWFRQEWIDRIVESSVEFRPIRSMIERAGRGLHFSRAASEAIRADYSALFDLPPADQLLGLLSILGRLAADRTATTLCTSASTVPKQEGRDRIDRVLHHIHGHHRTDIGMEDLADIAALSVSGLHRLFRRHTGTTASEYLIRMRIGEACSLLSATSLPIAHVAGEVGYGSLANFNRQFKRLRGVTPREYRMRFVR
ncbi:helix-turn-helix domain-containing protein [Rhizobium sp. LjRoot254]|uniref:helix-turn-helix domain-containing protein n=1 Tax=Rhizobium sp. LjRoot254 TaxID=3342297 RepID=UPI003ECE59D3